MLNLSLNTSRAMAGNLAGNAGETVKLQALAAYARGHGFVATVEPCGMGRHGALPCVAVVIPWTACDEHGKLVATGERVFTARTFRGLRAILGY